MREQHGTHNPHMMERDGTEDRTKAENSSVKEVRMTQYQRRLQNILGFTRALSVLSEKAEIIWIRWCDL